MEQRSSMMKVICPVEGKNGKTFWIRIGSAFTNRDGSTNVYLNAYPTSGKLQIREMDDRDRQPQSADSRAYGAGGATAGEPAQDDMPF